MVDSLTTLKNAFIYLWYVAATKMFYLGVHNGKDPYYTHSAISSKEFNSIVPSKRRPISERKEFLKNMPKGISRKILVYGTEKEMRELEHELLVNRKKRCWHKYYNESLGDPRYVDTSGENNRNWKGGISIGDNLEGYHKKNYQERKKLCNELMEQGLTYYDIEEQYPNALVAYPYSLLPKEEKEKIEKRNKGYQLKNRKHECYCRQYECDYCGPMMIEKHGTKEEVLKRRRQADRDRYYRDRSDSVKLTHKRKVSRAWEEKNKEKRRRQKRVWHQLKKGPIVTLDNFLKG